MAQYITKEGLQKLKDELQDLKNNKVRETRALIKEAAAFGDLKENAAYHDARDKMAFLKGRIEQLEAAINEAIIKEKSSEDVTQIGSKVKILFDKEEMEYEITAPGDADILKNKVSYKSPLGKELLGKKPGDCFTFGPKSVKVKILSLR